ncbi:MAG: hypothetical protein ABIV50_08975 [Opitutus sp.]
MPPFHVVSAPWLATPAMDLQQDVKRLSPLAVDERWQALGQAWRDATTDQRIHGGWARVEWSPSALHFDAVFLGSSFKNRAATLNERTWELGDVCEIFVHASHVDQYVELHVTPENQRLQLLWPAGAIDRVRRDEESLTRFMVDSPHWVRSSTYVGPGFWSTHVVIPLACLGVELSTSNATLRAAVGRYDWGELAEPVLSSTAPLKAADYHRWNEWQVVKLTESAP